jgi:hypothetical protein
MKVRLGHWIAIAGILILTAGTRAAADPVTINLTGVNGVVQGGVFVDPYYGTVAGAPETLFCDDYGHDSYLNTPFQANVETFGNLTGVRFPGATSAQTLQDYGAAAYLVEEMLANPANDGDLSFALWALFDPSVTSAPGFDQGAANDLYAATHPATPYTASEFSDFYIYTPVCSGAGCASSQQEFLSMGAPEPGALALLILGLGMLFGVAILGDPTRRGATAAR